MMLSMNKRTVIMIAVALVAAAGTALFIRGWLNAQRVSLGDRTPAPPSLEVLVTKNDVPAGHFIKAQSLRWQAWPEGTLTPTYVVKGKGRPQDFDGAVVRSGIAAGQPVTETMVVRPGEQGFLAAVLNPGKRAVSIQVNAISGISGFVFPGDRVDMVLTHTIKGESKNSARHVAETVLQDIRVLAVDQKTDDQNGKASIAKTVTFEVTPKQVEKIGIISRLGKISLSLRPVAREPMPEPAEKAGEDAVEKTGIDKEGMQKAEAGHVPARPTAKPSRTSASLSPISRADAAQASAADGVQFATRDGGHEGDPVQLIRIEPETATVEESAPADSEAAETTVTMEDEVTAVPRKADVAVRREKPAAGKATPRTAERTLTEEDLIPPRERAGITMDTEVSRVIGRERRDYRPKVQVVRGGKVEERRF